MHTVILENGLQAERPTKDEVLYKGVRCAFLHMGDGTFTVRTEEGFLRVVGCIERIRGKDVMMHWRTIYGYENLLPFIDQAFIQGWQDSVIAFHCYSGTCFFETEKDCWLNAEGGEIMSLPTVEAMETFIRERDED